MFCRSAAVLLGAAVAHDAWAFPPYRTTDADTAKPGELELRLGLLAVTHDAGSTEWSTPALRANVGFPAHLELTTEVAWEGLAERLADAAVGVKWAPARGPVTAGAEVLALLPVDARGGAGVEGTLLCSWWHGPTRVHLNAGGAWDARPAKPEPEWGGSVLAEQAAGPVRVGAELRSRWQGDAAPAAQLGLGVIASLGPVDARLGGHLGLTRTAPAVAASLWVTTAVPLIRRAEEDP